MEFMKVKRQILVDESWDRNTFLLNFFSGNIRRYCYSSCNTLSLALFVAGLPDPVSMESVLRLSHALCGPNSSAVKDSTAYPSKL